MVFRTSLKDLVVQNSPCSISARGLSVLWMPASMDAWQRSRKAFTGQRESVLALNRSITSCPAFKTFGDFMVTDMNSCLTLMSLYKQVEWGSKTKRLGASNSPSLKPPIKPATAKNVASLFCKSGREEELILETRILRSGTDIDLRLDTGFG